MSDEYHRQFYLKRRKTLLDLGICTLCGSKPISICRSKSYCDECLDRRKNSQKIYYSHHKKEIVETQKRCEKSNPAIYKEIKSKWVKNNPDKIYASVERRRTKIAKADGDFSAKEWRDLKSLFGNICLWCGQRKPLTVDHVVPLSKGGTNWISNIQPLCKSCNSKKNNKIIDFRPFGNIILDWT